MSDYASLTVAQLKELLKAKSLPLDGKKADLIARLTESEAGSNELDELDDKEEIPETATEKPEETASEPQPETETTETAENGEKTEAEPAEPAKPKPKQLTPEERKQLAVDLLTKKIKRAEKFGDEASAKEARSNLARVEKFGVDPGTALAKEIGAVSRGINSELSTQKFSRVKKNKNKNKKNKNKGPKPQKA